MIHAVELEVGGRLLRLETGRMAKQADGAVLATYADTVILATAVSAKTMKPDIDFLPLTVNYQEKAYAAGKIPGGYFRREGAPSEKEVLTSRLIDRPIRPLMPEGYYCETQIIVSVLSVDQTMSSDIIGIVGASAAMAISDIPCDGPLAAVRIGRINGAFIVNPDQRQLESSELNLVVAGTKSAVLMVEAGANGLSEDTMIDAIELAHQEIQKIVDKITELCQKAGRTKRVVEVEVHDTEIEQAVRSLAAPKIGEAMYIPGKSERQERFDQIRDEAVQVVGGDDEERKAQVKKIFHNVEYSEVRRMILTKKLVPMDVDSRIFVLSPVKRVSCHEPMGPPCLPEEKRKRWPWSRLGLPMMSNGLMRWKVNILERLCCIIIFPRSVWGKRSRFGPLGVVKWGTAN